MDRKTLVYLRRRLREAKTSRELGLRDLERCAAEAVIPVCRDAFLENARLYRIEFGQQRYHR